MPRLPALTRALGVTGREAVAYARQAWLLRHDLGTPSVPPARAGDDVVVLLHGIFASAGVLRPLRASLERRARVHTTAITYAPGARIHQAADRLASLISRLPADARVHVVGHSLGGVVARWYAETSREPRVVQTVSLASPFGGVRGARFLGAWGRDIEPESAVLRRVRLGGAGVPHLSVIAADDAVVRAPRSHALPSGDVVVLDGCGHNALLFDAELMALLERRILSVARARAQAAEPPQASPG
ncbi:MAG: alpha/beta fold hydrolase [Polyangiaceae bacterium]